MRISIDAADLERNICSKSGANNIETISYTSPNLVYFGYKDNPYYTWEAFIMCLKRAKYDAKCGHMISRIKKSEFNILFQSLNCVSGFDVSPFIERWCTHSDDNFYNFCIYDGLTGLSSNIISNTTILEDSLEVSFSEDVTQDIKRLDKYYDEYYIKEMTGLETIEGLLLYHILYTEAKRLADLLGESRKYCIELTEKEFVNRGLIGDDIGEMLEETRDEINKMSHLWYEFDEVISDRALDDKINLCYRIIFGLDKEKHIDKDISCKNRIQNECLDELSAVIDGPIDEGKIINALEAANYNLELVKAVYESMMN